jgi:hypothetical protein
MEGVVVEILPKTNTLSCMLGRGGEQLCKRTHKPSSETFHRRGDYTECRWTVQEQISKAVREPEVKKHATLSKAFKEKNKELSAVQGKLEENKSSLPTCRSNLLMIHKCPATDREKVRGLLCRRLVRTKQVPRCVDRGKGREILYRRALQNRLP